MSSTRKPIYLLADSQLLFWKERDHYPLRRIRSELESDSPLVSYVGASNGDDVRFFEICRAAMEAVGIADCRMVSSCFAADDRRLLETADLVVLAGGEIERGWKIFDAVGLRDAIVNADRRRAVLLGVSAGAVQLGLGAYASETSGEFVNTFGFVPFVIGAHDEANDWHGLRRAVARGGSYARGIGLPSGGGMVYHRDGTVEPLRKCLQEFRLDATDELRSSVLVGDSLAASHDSPRENGPREWR